MIKAEAVLKSISPYSQSKHYETAKKEGESFSAYEERTWRDRVHCDDNGDIFIPPMAFKNSIAEAAKYRSDKVPGKNRATWTKHFEAGILVMDPLFVGVKKEKVRGEWLFVPSDGKRGGGSRVSKCFPLIPEWSGTAIFYIIDSSIPEEQFSNTLKTAGSLIGIGRFKPKNNGFYGRFKVESVSWKTEAD